MVDKIKEMIKDPNFQLKDGIKKLSEMTGAEVPEEIMNNEQLQAMIALGQSVMDSIKEDNKTVSKPAGNYQKTISSNDIRYEDKSIDDILGF